MYAKSKIYGKRPIPLVAIRDFKDLMRVGDEFNIKVLIQVSDKKEVLQPYHCKVAKKYPHFALMEDGKSISYFELMTRSGWWNRFKSFYYSEGGDAQW